MERVIVNEGTKVNLYNLFEDLQNYTQLNSLRLISTLFTTFGVNAQTNLDGSVVLSDNALKVGPGPPDTSSYGYVTVEAGDALTANLSWIGLTSQAHAITHGLSIGTHYLYLSYAPTYSAPVDVLSGFALSLAGGTQRNSRSHDGSAFVWDADPGVSGIILAQVTVASMGNSIAADLRSTNVLMLKSSVIPAQAFLGNQASSIGAPPPPKNFRMTDINGATISNAVDPSQASSASRSVARGAPSQELALDVAWNWDNCEWAPYGTNQVFLVFHPGQWNAQTDEFVGYHIWHPAGYDYVITANTSGAGTSLITAEPFDSNGAPINSLPAINGGGVIHCNASMYDLLTVPVALDKMTQIFTERYEDQVYAPIDGKSGPVILKTKVYPYVGEHVLLQIRSVGPLGQASIYNVMPAGSFTSNVFLSPVIYGSPFLAKMPYVSDAGVGVSAIGQAGGFTVTVSAPATTGWSHATSFEVIWADSLATLSFDSLSNTSNSIVSTSKVIGVSFPTVTSDTKYLVKVRPLIGGVACSDGLPVNGVEVHVGSTIVPVVYTKTISALPSAKTYSGTLAGPFTYSVTA